MSLQKVFIVVPLLILLLPLPVGAAEPRAIAAEPRTIAVDIPADAAEIADSLNDSGWVRWLLARNEGPAVVVGPNVDGDVKILVRLLPIDAATAELLRGLPVRLDDGFLELDGSAYRQPQHALALRLPAAGKRTWLVTGSRSDPVASLVGLVLSKEAGVGMWGRDDTPFDYLLRETAWLERSGTWRPTPTGFAVDREGERNDFSARDAHYAAMGKIPGRSVELTAPVEMVGRDEIRDLARRLDAAATEMAKRIPLRLERPIEVLIERDHVAQGRYLGDIGAAVLTARGAVHLVYHPDDEHAYRHRIAGALLARAGFSGSLPPWIEDGAALWLSGGWYGREWRDWLPRLAAARVLPSAEQLLAGDRQEDASALLWVPVAASLVDAAPGDTLRQKLAALPGKAAVRAHLAAEARRRPAPAERSAAAERPAARSVPFLRGVSFAMLNRIDGGYHAPSVDESLRRLRQLGADAVSLMPFAYQPAPGEPQLRFLNDSPTSETDVGLLYAARRARAAGFRVLWKPHIWLSHGSWPGEIAMSDEASWAAWWESYRRYVTHHAFLAEWAGSELFSIGVELGKTLGRQREWDELITAVRELYSGAVTYSGNWHADYDLAPFWDRLDFIGVDAYFPLSAAEDAGPAALAAGAAGIAERLQAAAKRFGKPVILTEVGYAARAGAWVEPHREGGAFSAEHQALAYRALLEALGQPPWLGGIFAWKVFSADRGGDAGTRADFRFLGRPAEAVLREYFAPAENRARRYTSNR